MALTVDKSAQKWFFQLQNDDPKNNKVLVVALKTAGCSGFEYTLKWESSLPNDFIYQEIFENGKSIKVGYSQIFDAQLNGLILKYEKQGISQHLVYENPNVDMACGCGLSVNFK